MSVINDWPETAREVVGNPGRFYTTVERSDGYGYPLMFAAVSFLIAGIITAIGAAVFTPTGLNPVTAAVSSLIGSVVGGIIGLFIGAGLVHIFVYLFGGRGYRDTFEVAAYATVLTPVSALVGLVPIIGGLLGLLVTVYLLYIWIKGLESYHDLTTLQAALSVLLPAIILGILAFIAVLLFLSAAVISGLAPVPA